jgi:hypothetical protein
LFLAGLIALLSGQVWLMVAAPGAAPSWLGVAGVTATLVGVLLLAAPQAGVSRSLAVAALLAGVIVGGGLSLALVLAPETLTQPLWFGLPRRAAIVLVGVGLLPALVLPWCYLRDAAADPLDEAAIARLAADAERVRAGPPE